MVTDGETALRTLLEDDPPDLVLLDLNLPRLSGHEILSALHDAGVRRLPGGRAQLPPPRRPMCGAPTSYGARSHIAKPDDMDALFTLAETLARYWFATVTLP